MGPSEEPITYHPVPDPETGKVATPPADATDLPVYEPSTKGKLKYPGGYSIEDALLKLMKVDPYSPGTGETFTVSPTQELRGKRIGRELASEASLTGTSPGQESTEIHNLPIRGQRGALASRYGPKFPRTTDVGNVEGITSEQRAKDLGIDTSKPFPKEMTGFSEEELADIAASEAPRRRGPGVTKRTPEQNAKITAKRHAAAAERDKERKAQGLPPIKRGRPRKNISSNIENSLLKLMKAEGEADGPDNSIPFWHPDNPQHNGTTPGSWPWWMKRGDAKANAVGQGQQRNDILQNQFDRFAAETGTESPQIPKFRLGQNVTADHHPHSDFKEWHDNDWAQAQEHQPQPGKEDKIEELEHKLSFDTRIRNSRLPLDHPESTRGRFEKPDGPKIVRPKWTKKHEADHQKKIAGYRAEIERLQGSEDAFKREFPELSVVKSLLKIMKEHTPEHEAKDIYVQRQINQRNAPGEHGQEPFDVERYEKNHEEGGITHPRNVFKYLNHLADERYKVEPVQTRKDATPFDRLPYTSAPGLKDTLAKHGWDYKQTGHEPGHGVQQDNEDHLQDNIERLGKTHGDTTGVMQDLIPRGQFDNLSKPMSPERQARGRPNPNFYNSIEKIWNPFKRKPKPEPSQHGKEEVDVPDTERLRGPYPSTLTTAGGTTAEHALMPFHSRDTGPKLSRRTNVGEALQDTASPFPEVPERESEHQLGRIHLNSIENSILKIMKYGSDINPSEVGMTKHNALKHMDKAQAPPEPPPERAVDFQARTAGAQNDDPEGIGRGAADAIGQFASMFAGGKGSRWQYEQDKQGPPSGGSGQTEGGTEEEAPPVTPPSGPAGGDTTQTQQTKIDVPSSFPDPTQNQQNQTQIKPPPTGNKVTVPNV